MRVQVTEGNLTVPILFSGSWTPSDDPADMSASLDQVIVAVPVSKPDSPLIGSVPFEEAFNLTYPGERNLTGREGSSEVRLREELSKRGNSSVRAEILGAFHTFLGSDRL
jgi:hypothetical protein